MVVCRPVVVPFEFDGVNESRYVAADDPAFVMRMSDRNGTTPSTCATAGTINASLGGGAVFADPFTGVTRLIDTVVLLLRESFGTTVPFAAGALTVIVPVLAPTKRLLGSPRTVRVTVPSVRTVPEVGVTVRYGLSVVTVNAAPGIRPENVTVCVTWLVLPNGTMMSKSRDVAGCCGRTTICAEGPNDPADPPQETGRTR